MNKYLFSIVMTALVIAPGIGLAQAPHEVGGFVLGRHITVYNENVEMDTALPVRYAEYIKGVEIKDVDGFKSGLIGFGTCDAPGKVLRIKLKYSDGSKKFYEKLLKRYKKRFGEPDEWRGDPFHIVLAWKWSFTDKDDNRISLIAQHNTRDTEEKMGNAVKLTMSSQVDKEAACFEKKHAGFRGKEEKKGNKKKMSPKDWERFIPR